MEFYGYINGFVVCYMMVDVIIMVYLCMYVYVYVDWIVYFLCVEN